MKYVPKGLTRFGHRSMLKLSASSPTIMVVAGVVGFGATAVLAAKATRNIDQPLEDHAKQRQEIKNASLSKREEQRALLGLYIRTGTQFGRIYGPTIALGAVSTASILYGHKILHGRHVASIAAYSGLMEQFQSYRTRVARTLGEDVEKGIYEGAHGEWVEDPNHKGEYKLEPKFDPAMDDAESYRRPFFDELNPNWTRDATANYGFLKGVQSHANVLLRIRGHLTVNEVRRMLGMGDTKEGMVCGWVYPSANGDEHVDLGFMGSIHPQAKMFQNGVEPSVRLNFNDQGNIYDLI